MTSIISRLFGSRPSKPDPVVTEADESYAAAVRESDDLLAKMKAAYESTDPVRQAMADIWAQRHNVPFQTTITEAVQEMNAPLYQQPARGNVKK